MSLISSTRVYSIDVFRALTMLLMIFVNDLWSLKGVPKWMEHATAEEDYLGLADIVFPCFLFIVGMSVPYAVKNRLSKGDSVAGIAKHIVLRSVALLIMGVFTVNLDYMNADATGISRQWFRILMVAGFFLIWNVYPKNLKHSRILFPVLQLSGVLLLAFLAWRFRGNSGEEITGLRIHWWGILGLIGWAYLICALIYLVAYKYIGVLVAAWLFFPAFNIASQAGWITDLMPWFPTRWMVGHGAFHAFTFTGIMATLLLDRFKTKWKVLSLWYTGAGLLFVLAGIWLNSFFIISKIKATPPWVFICSGIAILFFTLIYYIVDIREKGQWFNSIRVAGTYTLTCYLVPYVFYSLCVLSGIHLPDFLKEGIVGLLKSMTFSFLVIGITALLVRFRIRLKI